jgi:hypothetical protein
MRPILVYNFIMVKKWWWLLLVIISFTAYWVVLKKPKDNVQQAESKYHSYENKKGKYKIFIPKGWKEEESTESSKFLTRVVFKRTNQSEIFGNMAEMSVTVIASPSSSQLFSKKSEFDILRNKSDQSASEDGLFKLKNEKVAGLPAVRLAEVQKKWWSVTTWFIKNNISYYINMMGNGNLTDIELVHFSKILSSFTWL